MPLDRDALDRAAAHGCQVPGCQHKHDVGTLFLHGRCHVGAPVQASYTNGTGVLRIECSVCEKLICDIQVHER